MKFTEKFIELPVLCWKANGGTYNSVAKVNPEHIYGWVNRKASDDGEILEVDIAVIGALYVTLTAEEFEKLINGFVGEPVTYNEKQLAIISQMLEKLKE